jgi:hypothetical protein
MKTSSRSNFVIVWPQILVDDGAYYSIIDPFAAIKEVGR